jgi:hypothetical protein
MPFVEEVMHALCFLISSGSRFNEKYGGQPRAVFFVDRRLILPASINKTHQNLSKDESPFNVSTPLSK